MSAPTVKVGRYDITAEQARLWELKEDCKAFEREVIRTLKDFEKDRKWFVKEIQRLEALVTKLSKGAK